MQHGNALGHVCLSVHLCVCVCVFVRSLNFQSFDLETSFLICRYIFRTSRSVAMRSRSSHISTDTCTHVRLVRLQLKGNVVVADDIMDG